MKLKSNEAIKILLMVEAGQISLSNANDFLEILGYKGRPLTKFILSESVKMIEEMKPCA